MKAKNLFYKTFAYFLMLTFLLPLQVFAEYSPTQKSSLMQMNNALNDMSIALQGEIDYANKIRNDANQIPESFRSIVIYNPHGALNVGLETIDLWSYIAVCSSASMTLSRNERRASELHQLMNQTLSNIDNAAVSGLTLPVSSAVLKTQVSNTIQKQYGDAVTRRNTVLNGVNWNVVGDGFMDEITRIVKDISSMSKDIGTGTLALYQLINPTGEATFSVGSEIAQELTRGSYPIRMPNGKVLVQDHFEMSKKIAKLIKTTKEIKEPGDKFQEIVNSDNPDKSMLKYLIDDFIGKTTAALRNVEENKALFEALDNYNEVSKDASELKAALDDLSYAKQQISDVESWKPNYAQFECANTIKTSFPALQKRLLEKKYWRAVRASMMLIGKVGKVLSKALTISNPMQVKDGGIAKFKNFVTLADSYVNSIVTFNNHLYETDFKAKSAMVYKRYMDASLISDNTFKATMGQVRANLKSYCQSSVKPLLDSLHSNLKAEPETINGAVCYKIAADSPVSVSLIQPNSTIWDGVSPYTVAAMVSAAPNKGVAIHVVKDEKFFTPVQLKQISNNYVGNNTYSVDLATNDAIKRLPNGAYVIRALVDDVNNRRVFSDKISLTISRGADATNPKIELLTSNYSLNEKSVLTLRAITENAGDTQPAVNIVDAGGKLVLQSSFNYKLQNAQGKQHWQYQAPVGVKGGSYQMFAKLVTQDGKAIESNRVPLNVSAVGAPPAPQPAMQGVSLLNQPTLNQPLTLMFNGQYLTSDVRVTMQNCVNTREPEFLDSSQIRLSCVPQSAGLQSVGWKPRSGYKDPIYLSQKINVLSPEVQPQCPSGNGNYCGDGTSNRASQNLYSCVNGQYNLIQTCQLGCVKAGTGKNDFCKLAEIPQPNINIKAVYAQPNVVNQNEFINFVADLSSGEGVAKVELVFTDAGNLTEPMERTGPAQWVRKNRKMERASPNRPFQVKVTLANASNSVILSPVSYYAVNGTPTPQPPPVQPAVVITGVSANPNVVSAGQPMSFVANLSSAQGVSKVDLIFSEVNVVEPMRQTGPTQWSLQNRAMSQAGVNRPYLVKVTMANGQVVTSQEGRYTVNNVPAPMPPIMQGVSAQNQPMLNQPLSLIFNGQNLTPDVRVTLANCENGQTQFLNPTQIRHDCVPRVAGTQQASWKINQGDVLRPAGVVNIMQPAPPIQAPQPQQPTQPLPLPVPQAPAPAVQPSPVLPPTPANGGGVEVAPAQGCSAGGVKMCGVDGRTYPNVCTLQKYGVAKRANGACQ